MGLGHLGLGGLAQKRRALRHHATQPGTWFAVKELKVKLLESRTEM